MKKQIGVITADWKDGVGLAEEIVEIADGRKLFYWWVDQGDDQYYLVYSIDPLNDETAKEYLENCYWGE